MRRYFEHTNLKIVQSGAIFEQNRYLDYPVNYGSFINCKPYSLETVPQTEEEKLCYINRIKVRFRRLVQANVKQYPKPLALPPFKPQDAIPYLAIPPIKQPNSVVEMPAGIEVRSFAVPNPYPPTLLTLTKKDKSQNMGSALGDFFNFIKRFEYGLGKNLKYISVPEYHKKGGIHFHTIFFNQDYMRQRDILDIWANRNSVSDYSVDIRRADRIGSLGLYLLKYMKKSFSDERFKGHKKYHPAHDLIQPQIFYEQEKCEQISAFLTDDKLVFKKDIKSKYVGRIEYKMFDFAKTPLAGSLLAVNGQRS
jgi:hypothetical protein